MPFFEPRDKPVQRVRDGDVHKRQIDVNFDPLSRFELWLGWFLGGLNRPLRLAIRRDRKQAAHNKSEYADEKPISSRHHRIACLRRRCPCGYSHFRLPTCGHSTTEDSPRKASRCILTINLLYDRKIKSCMQDIGLSASLFEHCDRISRFRCSSLKSARREKPLWPSP